MMTSLVQRALLTVLGALLLAPMAAQAQYSLTTEFTGTNQYHGNIFDVYAVNSVVVTDFDVNTVGTAGTPYTIEVYTMVGSGMTEWDNPKAWTLVETVNVTANGPGVATPLGMTQTVSIPAGTTQSFYVTTDGGTSYLHYSNTKLAQGDLFVSDANLEIYVGLGMASPFVSSFSPRLWNGTIHYDVGEFDCSNGLDDDNDGAVDCMDTECWGDAACLLDVAVFHTDSSLVGDIQSKLAGTG